MIGADTSFLIDFLNDQQNAVEWMDEHKNVLYLCENVIYEFLCGNLSEQEQETFLGFASQFPVLSFDRDAALRSAKIFRKGKDTGNSIPHPDAAIAGTYAAHEIEKIVTRNPDHFDTIDTITVLQY
jgi:predicted nucleic acid-binding protein